jgi:SAM-dependent methyltransferase
LEFIQLSKVPKDGAIIDIGGGASVLVDRLLELGYKALTVLDISGAALNYSKERLGERSKAVNWVEADITQFDPATTFEVWHDRAVFHFLTDAADRSKYVSLLGRAVKPGGHLVLASFAPDGPEKCSGLPVCRYDARLIGRELGGGFELLREDEETHQTPWDKEQKFRYFLYRRTR